MLVDWQPAPLILQCESFILVVHWHGASCITICVEGDAKCTGLAFPWPEKSCHALISVLPAPSF